MIFGNCWDGIPTFLTDFLIPIEQRFIAGHADRRVNEIEKRRDEMRY
jgi:hypothetical protein